MFYPDIWEYNGDNALWAVKKCNKSGGRRKRTVSVGEREESLLFYVAPFWTGTTGNYFQFSSRIFFSQTKSRRLFPFLQNEVQVEMIISKRTMSWDVLFYRCNLSRKTEEEFWTLFLNSLKLCNILPFYHYLKLYKFSFRLPYYLACENDFFISWSKISWNWKIFPSVSLLYVELIRGDMYLENFDCILFC